LSEVLCCKGETWVITWKKPIRDQASNRTTIIELLLV